jgi:uncharacterized membrane protein YeaQ/YmgE (transglycosylase-associated protein family)
MSLIIALITGGIVGWLAARVAGREEGIFASVAIGVVGGIIGSLLVPNFFMVRVFLGIYRFSNTGNHAQCAATPFPPYHLTI